MPLTAEEQAELDAIKASFTPDDEAELQALRASVGPSAQQAGLNPAYNQPMQVSPTTFHEGGTVTRGTGVTAAGTANPELISRPEYSAQDLEKRQSTLKDTFTRDAPVAAGSILGTVAGGAIGGVPGSAIGDMLGTAGGYEVSRRLRGEPFSLKEALMTVGPSVAVNAYSGLVRPPAQALARSSQVGRQAAIDQSNASVRTHNAAEEALNTQAKAAFETAEQARVQQSQQATLTVQQRNVQTRGANTAADDVVTAFNAKAKADLEHAQALQARAQATAQGEFNEELRGYNVVLAQQAEEKARQAEILRGMQMAQRQGNVPKTEQFAAQMLPVVPSTEQVETFYLEAQTAAEKYGVSVVFPELQAVRKVLRQEAASARKGLGDTPLARSLDKLGGAGGKTGELTLQDVQTTLSMAKAQAADPNKSPVERRAYGRIIEATETGLENLAERSDLPNEFRFNLKLANQANLQRRSHEDMARFLAEDAAPVGADGVRGFSAPVALKKLDDKSHTAFRNFLKKTTLPDSTETLYDRLRGFLTTLSSKDFQALEAQRDLVKKLRGAPAGKPFNPVGEQGVESARLRPQADTRPPAVPRPLEALPEEYTALKYQGSPQLQSENTTPARPGLLATGVNLGSRAGLTIAGAALAGQGRYPAGVLALTGVAGLPYAVSALLMTERGTRMLLGLVRAQGQRFTPAMMGFVTAAARSFLDPAGSTEAPSPGGP